MDRIEHLLRELIRVTDEAAMCDECVPMAEALCDKKKRRAWQRAVAEAKRLLRQRDQDRAAAKLKPN